MRKAIKGAVALLVGVVLVGAALLAWPSRRAQLGALVERLRGRLSGHADYTRTKQSAKLNADRRHSALDPTAELIGLLVEEARLRAASPENSDALGPVRERRLELYGRFRAPGSSGERAQQ